MSHSVYALVRIEDSYIIYVGVSKNLKTRLSNLRAGWKTTNDNHPLHKHIRGCNNNEIAMVPLQVVYNHLQAFDVEHWYISFILSLGFDLANNRQDQWLPFANLQKIKSRCRGVTQTGIKQVEILYFKNKFKLIR